jgi:hypothetical protein
MNGRLVLAGSTLVITAVLMAAILLDVVSVSFFLGPFRFSHWMTWVGSMFVAIYVPIYHVFKQKYPGRYKVLLDIHNFGFLLAFMLISVHFAGQMSRTVLPDLGEGIALYITMVLLVATGILQRFDLRSKDFKRSYNLKLNRAVHVSLISAFYIVITAHAITNLV